MRLLLDTHIALWLAIEEHKLTRAERAVLGAADEVPFFSAVSIWEMRLKWHSLHPSGERKGPASPGSVLRILRDSCFEELSLTGDDAATSLEVSLPHKDPFDELLVAQAQARGLRLLTRDVILAQHPLAVTG